MIAVEASSNPPSVPRTIPIISPMLEDFEGVEVEVIFVGLVAGIDELLLVVLVVVVIEGSCLFCENVD
jgi:hypothetical protein